MKCYIIEQYKDDPPVTMSRIIFAPKRGHINTRYARWPKHYSSFAAALKHKIKLEKNTFYTDFQWWITTKPIEN